MFGEENRGTNPWAPHPQDNANQDNQAQTNAGSVNTGQGAPEQASGDGSQAADRTADGGYPSADWASPQPVQPVASPQYGSPEGFGAPDAAYADASAPQSAYQAGPYGDNAATFAPGYPGTPGQTPAAPAAPTPARASKKGPSWLALVIAMLLTAVVAVGASIGLGLSGWIASGTAGSGIGSAITPSTNDTAESTVPQVESQNGVPDWEAVAKAVGPAVVTINVNTQSSQSVGSGVVYDQQGHIVTNYHVISTAAGNQGQGSQITVTLSNGSLYQADIVGSDQSTDLAVLAIKNPPSALTTARFGSSSELTVGQSVMAIGAPLGLSNTATTGIVSALNRPVEVSTSEQDQQQQLNPLDPFGQLEGNQNQSAAQDSVITNAIQVDASINPGNSGGPLFDQTGAVIGINSSIASMSSSSDSAGSIGLGFAIPSNLVKSVADQLISQGTVDHAVLGVTIQDGTATVDSQTRTGAQVASVVRGGSAAEGGIKEGDVILSVDGQQVTGAKSLTGYIRTYQGGATVTLEVARNNTVQKIQVTLQSKTDQ